MFRLSRRGLPERRAQELKTESEGRVIQDQEPDHAENPVLQSQVEWEQEANRVADQLPWFGEPPFEPAPKVRSLRSGVDWTGTTRRILISFLVGRPVSDIAARAGCSARLVHKVVRDLFYSGDPAGCLENWFELGLLAVVDTPDYDYAGRKELRDYFEYPVKAWDAHVFCLVCHRLITAVRLSERHHDIRIIDPRTAIRELLDHSLGLTPSLQAHLILHFRLGTDPIPRPDTTDRDYLMNRYQETGSETAGMLALHASQNLPPERMSSVERLAYATGENLYRKHPSEEQLTPVIGGTPMSLQGARRMWRRMLKPDP